MTTSQQDLQNDPYRLAINAAERLRAALAVHGITIPSLRGGYPVRDMPMVELGECATNAADELSAVLEKAAAGGAR
ncbi:hypothetical protein EDD99_0881 [Streptomyces sp. 846.5]|nr:hypothetical protein [Streptomyces sp. 846.5]TDU02488.1 hypothetical protein EDD99_0881 [Streptomyces sp. 846.5]